MGKNVVGGEVVWKDRKRFLGMPLSFTVYKLVRSEGMYAKLINVNGLLSTRVEDVNLYRVDDLAIHQSLFDKMFGVGTITVFCRDSSCDKIVLKNIKKPYDVYQLLTDMIAEDRQRVGMRQSEVQY